jgi:hypothetical protein
MPIKIAVTICPYIWNISRTDKLPLMKYDIGELSRHFIVRLFWAYFIIEINALIGNTAHNFDVSVLATHYFSIKNFNFPCIFCELLDQQGNPVIGTHWFSSGFAVWHWTVLWLPGQNTGCWHSNVFFCNTWFYFPHSSLHKSYKSMSTYVVQDSSVGSMFA